MNTNTGSTIARIATSLLPTAYGVFTIAVYRSKGGQEYPVLSIREKDVAPAMARIHSQCLTGDTFFSLRCDCREQLHVSMKMIAQYGSGVIVYLPQEGRGIGLADKIKAYALQEKGLDTAEANEALGHPIDGRDYGEAALILKDIGLTKIMLLTNNPDKEKQLHEYGIEIISTIRLPVAPNMHNRRYLETKRSKFGHRL